MNNSKLTFKAADERGYAIPIVIAVLFIAGTLALAATASAIRSQSQARHDRGVKRAMDAAQAGLDVAVYRLNMLLPAGDKCVKSDASATEGPDIARPGWCTRQPVETMPDGATYSYDVSTVRNVIVGGVVQKRRSIVSTAQAGGAVRRLAVSVSAETDVPLFGPYAAIGFDPDSTFQIGNQAKVWEDCARNHVGSTCKGSVFSGGQLSLGGPGGTICGDVTDADNYIEIASGGRLNPPVPRCPVGSAGTPVDVTSSSAVPALDARPSADSILPRPTVNDNCRLDGWFDGVAFPCGGDTTKPRAYFDAPAGTDGSIWNRVTGQLTLANNATLHLTGGDYAFCFVKLLKSSNLIIDRSVRVWLKRPEDCPAGVPAGATLSRDRWGSFIMESQQASLVNDATAPPSLDVSTFQIYLEGSDDVAKPTYFRLGGNARDDDFAGTVFAPKSEVTILNDGNLTGAVAGKTVSIENNFKLKYDDSVGQVINPIVFSRVERWVECTATVQTTVPDTNCDKPA